MSGPRHLVAVAHSSLGLELIIGTIAAMRLLGTLTTDEQGVPTNLPAPIVEPIPTTGGIGSPAIDANGKYAFGGWADNAIPDSAEGAADGTVAIATARAAAHPSDLTLHFGPPEGDVSPTWKTDSSWVDGGLV
jgi:hypothetical protein